jgi:hypothetical protein
VAQVAHLDTRVADATLAMFEKYIGPAARMSVASRRLNAMWQRPCLLFRRTIAALKRAKQAGEDGVAVVEREVGMAQLDRALPTIEAVADVADQDILLTAAEKYSVLRRFSPRFLASFQSQSNVPHDPMLAAIEAITFHRQGEIRARTFENQSFRASGLSLITAAIVHWNSVYLERAVQHLRAQGVSIPDDLLPHVAPLGWEHIALTGDYAWVGTEPASNFRPLNDVRPTFMPRAA